MKTRTLGDSMRWIAATAFLIALITPVRLGAQAQTSTKEQTGHHHYYKLIDIGTFGGPTSTVFGLTRPLNNRSVVTSCADTNLLDPNYPNINPFFGGDTFIQHAFAWRTGTLHDLGTLRNGTSSCGQWITDSGLIVGGATNGLIDPLLGVREIHAAAWFGGHIFDLGTFGGNESIAYGANDFGEVAGGALNTIPDPHIGLSNPYGLYNPFFINGATQVHAFLWRFGVLRDLGTLGTGADSLAFGVNDRGQVAGVSFTNATPNPNTGIPTVHPFLWENGHIKDLGTLGGTLIVLFGNINNQGQVVGAMSLQGDANNSPDGITRHPFLWDGHELKDLGTLGGSSAHAWWINDSGVVIGSSFTTGDQSFVAYVWKSGVMTDLGVLEGDCASDAQGINSSGQIVGVSFCNNSHAVLWENDGPIVDFQTLLVPGSDITLTEAVYINDQGEVAVNGQTPSGDNHAVLLIPCDENHPNIAGCDYSLVDPGVAEAASAVPLPKAPLAQVAQPPNLSTLSPAERAARLRSMLASHHGRFGLPQSK